jgi:uncharacterized protein YcbX
MPQVEISALYLYPVKSMRGIEVDSARLSTLGLEHDRRWMVVRGDGRFVTQRDLPTLALIETKLDENGIELSRNGHGSIVVPHDLPGGEPVFTRVWKDDCETLDAGPEWSRWLTSALESTDPLRLVRMAPGYTRPQSRPDDLGAGTTTAFADAAPLLVASEASHAALNRELVTRGLREVPMNRFRPNIVVRGLAAFAEHETQGLVHPDYKLKFCHPCQRCVVTTIDQDTAQRDPDWQPYRTLCDINPMPDNPRAPAFGQNAILEAGEGLAIRTGDPLAIADSSPSSG